MVVGPTPPGTGVIRRARGRRRRIDVADVARVVAGVDDDGAGLEPVAADEVGVCRRRRRRCRRSRTVRGQVDGARVAVGDGGVAGQQQHPDGLAEDGAAADDDGASARAAVTS